jgi:hypothetical protein
VAHDLKSVARKDTIDGQAKVGLQRFQREWQSGLLCLAEGIRMLRDVTVGRVLVAGAGKMAGQQAGEKATSGVSLPKNSGNLKHKMLEKTR